MENDLIEAVYIGNYDNTKSSLEAGANPNVLDENGDTPLAISAVESYFAISQLLLEFKADPNLGQLSPILIAVSNGDLALVKILLEAKANPNISYEMTTPLHNATLSGNTEISNLLVKFGAFTNIQDSRGNTPLHYAVYRANYVIAKILIDAGADPMIKDILGKTQIDFAGFFGLKYMLEIMIESRNVDKNWGL